MNTRLRNVEFFDSPTMTLRAVKSWNRFEKGPKNLIRRILQQASFIKQQNGLDRKYFLGK